MLIKNFNPKINFELIFSSFIIVTFLISCCFVANSIVNPTLSNEKEQITNTTISNIQPVLDNNLLTNPNSISSINGNLDQNIIIHYTSQSQKEAILNYVSKNGILVDQLDNLPFILAKISSAQLNYLKEAHVNIYTNHIFQAFPKNFLSDAVASANTTGYQAPIHQINGVSLQDQGYKGQNIKIAVIDTGIDETHPDLSNRVIYNVSYVTTANGYTSNEDSQDGNGHGTHVSALAAGSGAASNGQYIGVAPEAQLLNLKVGSTLGSATSFAILEAINEAINQHVNIITMSLGFDGSSPDDPISLALDDAVNNHGIVATISAGNSGPSMNSISTPGASRSVITVGASYWENDTATFFSSRGINSDYRYDPDLLAPGWQEVSALASQSITDLSEKYYTPTAVIQGTNGNYIAFSGTSMAAPVTAGSVAILLSKYPNLTPQAIRAVLMSTATNTGQPEYVQGAGFLNLAQADSFLSTHNISTSNTVDVVSLLPQRSIFPNDPLLFPGDQLKVNLQFVAGEQKSISISFDNTTLSDMMTAENITSLMHESSGGYYGELLLTFSVPINPIQGLYIGDVNVIIGGTVYSLNIGPVYVKIPLREIAWSTWYNIDSSDTPTGNFASLSTYLETQDIHLVVVDKPVDQSWIYQYDTIIFPDNELAMSKSAISLLKDYINNGGNVILISSYYPFTEIANYNELSSSYGITLQNSTDMNISDLGIAQSINPLNEPLTLHDFNSLQFNQLSNLKWFGGTPLKVSGSAVTIASLQGGTAVIAASKGNSEGKGQLFVFGSEFWFYNDFYGSTEQSFSNIFFNYIVNKTQPFINIVNNDQEVSMGQTWNATIFVGTNNFENVNNSIITVKEPNGSQINLTTTTPSPATQVGGELNFVPAQYGTYTMTVKYENKLVNTSFLVYSTMINYNLSLVTATKAENIPWFLTDTGSTIVDQGNQLQVQFNSTEALNNTFSVSAVITLVPEIYQQISGVLQKTNSLYSTEINLTKSGTLYQGLLSTSSLMNVGFYTVELVFTKGDYSLNGTAVDEFYLSIADPKIDYSTSTIDGSFISAYDLSVPNFKILTIKPGQTLALSIKSSSMLATGGSAFVLFVPYFPFFESQIIIKVWQLNQSTSNLFEGNITIPMETSLKEGARTLNFGTGLYTSLFIIVRDSQGNMDFFPIITNDNTNQLPVDETTLFFFFVILPGLIVVVYYFRSKNKRKNDYYNYNYNSFQFGPQNQPQYQNPMNMQQPIQNNTQDELKFCPYCGSNILPGENFCMECGKKLR